MNPLSSIEPATLAAASPPPPLKEDVISDVVLQFASFVEGADRSRAAFKFPAESDDLAFLMPSEGAEADTVTQLPESNIAQPLPTTSAPVEASRNANAAIPVGHLRPASPDPKQGDVARQQLEGSAIVPHSATLAKAGAESQLQMMLAGPSVAQTLIERRIAQLPHAVVGRKAAVQIAETEIATDPARKQRDAGQLQLPARSLESAPRISGPFMSGLDVPSADTRARHVHAKHCAPLAQMPQAQTFASGNMATPKQPTDFSGRGIALKDLEMTERSIKISDQDGLHGLINLDRATAAPSTTTGVAAAGSETARHVAHQMATAIVQGNGKATEIALNPEELGRVRLKLSAVDGALTLVVLAERQETQELLRRHIDILAEEFRSLGYDSVSFSFNSEGGAGHHDSREGARDDGHAATTRSAETEHATATVPSNGLDLRL